MSYLEAQNISRYFHAGSIHEIRALSGVSVAIERGRFVVLTGPSGAGKSTLLALLGALDRPTDGQVRWDGLDITRCSDFELARIRRRVGFIFQSFALIPNLAVWENIAYPLIPRGVSRGERFERARTALVRLGMEQRLLALPRELSGGEQQRVAIARAFAGQPELLLADEPTSNLDPDTASVLLEQFRAFHSQGGTLVISTHDPRLQALANQVHELRGGRLL